MRKLAISALVAMSLAGCANPNGRPPSSGYNVFYTQGDHLKDLVTKKSFPDAIKLYDDHEAWFKDKAALAPLLDQAAAGYNETWQVMVDEAIAKCSALTWPVPREQWTQVKAALTSCKGSLSDYSSHKLLTGSRQAQGIGALQQVTDGISQRIQADATNQMKAENPDSGRNFFDDYPAKVTIPANLFVERLAATFSPQDDTRVFRIARTYSAQLSNKAVKDELLREVGENFRHMAKTGSIAQIVRLYKLALGNSLAPSTIPITVGYYAASADGAPFPVSLDRDIPFDWKPVATLGGSIDTDFVVALGLTRAILNRKVGNYAQVSSTFLAGYQTLPNPDYQTAVLNMQRAQQLMANARTNQITASQDVTCTAYGCSQNPWSQLSANIGMIAAQKAFNDAQQQINSTPQTIQKPVYQPYSYETAVILTVKNSEFVAFVGRPKQGVPDAYSKEVLYSKDFTLVYKVHEQDNGSGRSSSYSKEADVDSWEKQPVKLSLITLLTEGSEKKGPVWAQVPAAFDRKTAFASNVTQPKAHAGGKEGPASGDRRFGSVVVIKAADSLGSGFYIAADTILTNAHVVSGQTFITMQTYDGASINGKVLTADKRRDLALIKTQTTGTPAKLSGKEVSVGLPVEVVGHPQGLQYTLTRGIVSQVRTMPPASGVGSGLVSYVQLDASISPGNSGGPVYQDGSVIGVATWKVALKSSENLNFAVHRDEVASFLRENGISP